MTVHDADIFLKQQAKRQKLHVPEGFFIESEAAGTDLAVFESELAQIIARYPGLNLSESAKKELNTRALSMTIWEGKRERV